MADTLRGSCTRFMLRRFPCSYDTSLFKRLQKSGYPVQMLKTQYRMHPQVRKLDMSLRSLWLSCLNLLVEGFFTVYPSWFV